MRKISILNLLLLVALIALGVSNWQSRVRLAEQEVKLASANEAADKFRDKLGHLKVVDPNRYQVRRINPQFGWSWAGDQRPPEDFQFRLYTPDVSGFDLFYKLGDLPESGFPQKGVAVLAPYHQGAGVRAGILKKEPAEMAIIVRANFFQQDQGTFSLSVEFDVDAEKRSISLHAPISDKEMPWGEARPASQARKVIGEGLKLRKDEPFDLDGPTLLVKKGVVQKDGQYKGFMMWIEPRRQAD